MAAVRLSALLVVALAAGGCAAGQTTSAGDFSGPKRQVADVIDRLETAASRGESEPICNELLAGSLVERLRRGRLTCSTLLRDALRDADRPSLTVKDVTISGSTATARVVSGTGDRTRTDVFRLVREKGGWRIAAFG